MLALVLWKRDVLAVVLVTWTTKAIFGGWSGSIPASLWCSGTLAGPGPGAWCFNQLVSPYRA